jgi:malate dehydrogenase (oxaloacetate-decarboxylating)(NADP+)
MPVRNLAYSPGVAEACKAIVEDEQAVNNMTTKGNLVAVITNGTAVLGLGDIGPLASKPVMEGKAVLFKKFAGIDVFDLEINEKDPHKLAEIVSKLEPTFGAINLEDIKAPDCFVVEETCRKTMNIPVFHDDQHGTAIVVGAAIFNGLRVVEKNIEDIKIVSTGGGAAGIACLNLLVSMGAKRENIYLVDHLGLVYEGRDQDVTPQKADYAQKSNLRTLDEVIEDADLFLGLSAPGILKPDMVKRMGPRPMIMALANPVPEIMPDEAKKVRPDAVIATGRSDFPNQVNNVLCFPFIFRGALDVGAKTINEEMKIACVKAIADLAMAESSEVVAAAYRDEDLRFGAEYLIPKPFDPRLLVSIAPAVAKAAMESGVAARPIENFDTYIEHLNTFVFKSGMLMKPVFDKARRNPRRVVYAEGEDERVLRAVQVVIDEKLAAPILVGRPDVVEMRCQRLGLRIRPGVDFEICNPQKDERYDAYWKQYHSLLERNGVSPNAAKTIIRTNTTAIAAIMVQRGEADAMICGTMGQYGWHLRHITQIIGKRQDVETLASLSGVILPTGAVFIADPYVNVDPTAEEVVRITELAAEEINRFGIIPKVGMISHSNFGSSNTPCAQKMRDATAILHQKCPDLEVEGEMHADSALDEDIRRYIFPNSKLKGAANLLVMASRDTANTSVNLLKALGDGLPVGPLLLGTAKTAHIATPSISSRGLVNLTALSVVDSQVAENA